MIIFTKSIPYSNLFVLSIFAVKLNKVSDVNGNFESDLYEEYE